LHIPITFRLINSAIFLSQDIPSGIKVIHYYGIPGKKIVQFLDAKHEEIRWKSRFANILLQILDFIVTLPFLLWVPKTTKESNLSPYWDEYQCHVLDTLLTLRWKQLSIYKFILKNFEFDYIYETNASSYIDIPNLLKETKLLNASPLYAGNVPAKTFVSGANRFFDRAALNLLVVRRVHWSATKLEDVAIGNLMRKHSIPIIKSSSLTLSSTNELRAISDARIESEYHFRTKSYVEGKRADSDIMKLLQERFKLIRARNSGV
jgi:hypothetical protein